MGFIDKAKNTAQDAAGKAKEQAGKVAGDKDTEARARKIRPGPALRNRRKRKDALK